MKPKFRLHVFPCAYDNKGDLKQKATAYLYCWSCTVEIPRDEGNTIKKHSGPCATAASAIGEATLLWRKYSHD